MLSIHDDDCDPEMIEALIRGASSGMSKAVIPEITTSSEILSAAFTFLDRTLRSIRSLQTKDERFHNAAQISKVLTEMLVDHGHVPN